jgi:hypothetical protein
MNFFKSIKVAVSNTTNKMMANNNLPINIQEKRQMYLNMPLEERRKNYSCGDEYVRLNQIQKWSTSVLVKYHRSKISMLDLSDFF